MSTFFCGDGEAKFWLEPEVEMARNYHLSAKQLAALEDVIRERKDDIICAWDRYFPPVEITNIDSHGIWVLVLGSEYFLPYEDFPWFKKAKVEDIVNVELHHGMHLNWPALDVDLTVDSLENPGQYPLVAEG